MDILVYYNMRQDDFEDIEMAVNTLNGIQHYFKFLTNELPMNISEIDLKCNSLPENITNDPQGYRIFIIDKPFNDNWFSHEENHYSIITTADWNNYFAPPSLVAYLIYQMVQAAVNFEFNLRGNHILRYVHKETVGCMFDFCGKKLDIRNGMRVGAICPSCRGILIQFGNHQEALNAIEKILDYVRLISIGRSPQIIFNQVYIIKHYEVPSEIHNVFLYGVKPALDELGFIGKIGNQQNSGDLFFNDINNDIASSKLILALIDSRESVYNLNTYIEYGMALGMGKDVFIICENKYIPSLPSDLHGIQVIEYQANDYNRLSQNIINVLRDYSIPQFNKLASK